MNGKGALTDAVDLVLSRACQRCHRPGRALCTRCLTVLRGGVRRSPGTSETPPGYAALDYDSEGSVLIWSYKERGNRALAPMLGLLLADAIATAIVEGQGGPTHLVPVPGHIRPKRGFDALAGILRPARRHLAERGLPTEVWLPIRACRTSRRMKTLGRDDRRLQVSAMFELVRAARPPKGQIIIVDDVLTTGATVHQLHRLLAEAGAPAHASAVLTRVSRA